MKNSAIPRLRAARRKVSASGASLVFALCLLPLAASASTCYGTTSAGRLEGGVQLPADGKNFTSYSSLGNTLGRTFVHPRVRDVVVDAYAATYQSMPAKRFVYGETGLAGGGVFKPHRTHQNGTSVDFMVPVMDRHGKAASLPTNALNKFGYALEFDAKGELDDLRIDFEALGEHLYQLAEAARQHGAAIQRVIFQKELVARLYQTRRGAYLRQSVVFMKATPWIRHDEHYHVDFSLPCRPLADYTVTAQSPR
jgi:penicillin-insensitive murein endopeptidase